MRSSSVMIAALASLVAAQPHPHGHAQAHERLAREHHQHDHAKRVIETEVVVEWVTETVTEVIEGTTTEWFTPSPSTPATTFATVTSTSTAGEFFETASSSSSSSTPVVVPATSSVVANVQPAVTVKSSSSSSVYVAPEPTTTSTTAAAVQETTSSSAQAAATEAATSNSGLNTGNKITWIGPTDGAYSSCGTLYESGSMFVAVNPGILPTCSQGSLGTKMSVTANGKTVSAYAIDKCMGCETNHIDVATAVYEALGWTTDDGGMHNTGDISWVIG